MDSEFDSYAFDGGDVAGGGQVDSEPMVSAPGGGEDMMSSMFSSDGELPPVMEGGYDAGPAAPTASQVAYDGDSGEQPGWVDAIDTGTAASDAVDLTNLAADGEMPAGEGFGAGNVVSAVSAGSAFAKAIDSTAAGNYGDATAQGLLGALDGAGSLGVAPAGVAGAAMGMVVDGDKASANGQFGYDEADGKPLSPMDLAARQTIAAGDATHASVGQNPIPDLDALVTPTTEALVAIPAFAGATAYDFGAGVIDAGKQVGSTVSGWVSGAWNALRGRE